VTFNPSLAFFVGVSCSDSSRAICSFSTSALYASISSAPSTAVTSSKTVSRGERFLFGEQESGVLNLDLVGVVGADMMDSEDLRALDGNVGRKRDGDCSQTSRAGRGGAALSWLSVDTGSQSYKSGCSQSQLK
jgi:hypothetical protein